MLVTGITADWCKLLHVYYIEGGGYANLVCGVG